MKLKQEKIEVMKLKVESELKLKKEAELKQKLMDAANQKAETL